MVIVSALKYFFKNFIALALFSLPAAIFFALKYDSTNFYNYILNLGNIETVTLVKIYTHFSLLPSFNVFIILLWAALLILSFCLLFSYIERHMKYGIKSYLKTFTSINYSIITVLPAFIIIIGLEELFALANALFIRLFSLSPSTFASIIMPVIFAALMLLLFSLYALISLWIPIRLVTGYSNKDSIRYSLRLTQGKLMSIVLGLVFPLLITAPIMVLLKQLSMLNILNTIIYTFCYMFILGYIPSYVMAAYFKITGMERKDIKTKLFKKFRY